MIEDPASAQAAVPREVLQHEIDHLAGHVYIRRMLAETFVSAASAAQHWTQVPIDEAKQQLSGA